MAKMIEDFAMGETIREMILPRAVLYYTGEIDDDEEDDGYDNTDDEEDEDDDEEEDSGDSDIDGAPMES